MQQLAFKTSLSNSLCRMLLHNIPLHEKDLLTIFSVVSVPLYVLVAHVFIFGLIIKIKILTELKSLLTYMNKSMFWAHQSEQNYIICCKVEQHRSSSTPPRFAQTG